MYMLRDCAMEIDILNLLSFISQQDESAAVMWDRDVAADFATHKYSSISAFTRYQYNTTLRIYLMDNRGRWVVSYNWFPIIKTWMIFVGTNAFVQLQCYKI